jgi:hypothetical protein
MKQSRGTYVSVRTAASNSIDKKISRAISSLILLSSLSRIFQENISCHFSPQSIFGAGWISVEITTTDWSCKITPLKRQQTLYT